MVVCCLLLAIQFEELRVMLESVFLTRRAVVSGLRAQELVVFEGGGVSDGRILGLACDETLFNDRVLHVDGSSSDLCLFWVLKLIQFLTGKLVAWINGTLLLAILFDDSLETLGVLVFRGGEQGLKCIRIVQSFNILRLLAFDTRLGKERYRCLLLATLLCLIHGGLI